MAMLAITSVLSACGSKSTTNSYYDLDVVEHTPDFYINDFAGVFTEAQKNELMNNAVSFDKEYSGIQVVITTVKSLDETVLDYEYVVEDADGNRVEDVKEPNNPKFTIEQVAYSMYSQYGIGRDDMGILILFSTGDREVRIETGRQMQFYITDSISGRLLDDYGMEYFSQDKFAEGLMTVQAAIINKIKAQVSTDWYTASQETQSDSKNTVVGDASSDSDESNKNSIITDTAEEKISEKGILWGFFGSITAAFAAIVAAFRQKSKNKAEKESLKKAWLSEKSSLEQEKNEEIEALRMTYQSTLDERDRNHEETLSSLKRHYQRLDREKDDIIRDLRGDLSDLQQQNSTLQRELEVITDKFNRAQRLHPDFNFEDEISEMIESEFKTKAQELDDRLSSVLSTSATKDNYDVFNRALSLLDSAQPEVKKYVTSDSTVIQNLYHEAVRLKQEYERAEQEKRDRSAAQAAYNDLLKIHEDTPFGNHRTYSTLCNALTIFSNLSAAEKSFFPDNTLIEKLKKLHRRAEIDHNDYEASQKAEHDINSIIGHIHSADEDDRDKLERAMRYYRALSSSQQEYFSNDLLSRLRHLISEAEADHRYHERRRAEEKRQAEEAARRRRAQQMHSSSFSHSSRSSFGGHGGRPSGGGASRRF